MDKSNLTIAVGQTMQKTRFLEELQKILDDTDVSVSRLEPICKACGKCCHFAEMSHRLYASTGEIALLVRDNTPHLRGPLTCPYQKDDICTKRKFRPLGCRTFFCEEHQKNNVTTALQDIYENSHRKITELHTRYEICYQYCELTEACVELNEGCE